MVYKMIRGNIKILFILFLVMFLFHSMPITAQEVEDESYFFLQTSLTTYHWNRNPDRNNKQDLIGLEYHKSNSKLYGIAYFQNSYFQPTWYIYAGKVYQYKEISNFNLYGKLTYGIISGYDDENGKYSSYMNDLGTFPAVIPSIGIGYEKFSFEVSLFGVSGYIANLGMKF